MLSIVIPTLEAEATIGRTLAAIAATAGSGEAPMEVIVADGGSGDATREIARKRGARVIVAPRGRGAQLAAGADAARGSSFLFLHADTIPGPGWAEAAERFAADLGNRRRAAVFRLALDDSGRAARRVERMAAWRTKRLGLPYGDQGLLIARAFYEELGGFRPLPLMEDVDMVRRIGRRRLVTVDVPALTSAARYRRDGYVARPLRNIFCVFLYFLRVSPRLIARIYYR